MRSLGISTHARKGTREYQTSPGCPAIPAHHPPCRAQVGMRHRVARILPSVWLAEFVCRVPFLSSTPSPFARLRDHAEIRVALELICLRDGQCGLGIGQVAEADQLS